MALREALIAAAIATLPAAAPAQVERFAVVAGNDAGTPPDVPLRWAEADAVRVASVLEEVGGVRPENLVLLRGRSADALRRALIAVNERIRESGRASVLFVYYSGHADAGALRLGETPLALRELEQLVRGSAATFRLLVLDACRSGALTRVKGGTPIPPFELRASERAPGEGAVFLTSSSASEDSQESDELKGSFFTHAFLSGLLGAADADGDGRVTLDEAYRHAYDATVRSSSRTLAGLQHPTFQYDVRGHGDVVLSTLSGSEETRAWLAFPAGIDWLVFRGSADGPVVGEIGRADQVRRLSVREGTYFLRGRAPDALLEGARRAPAGATVPIDPAGLARTAYARLVRKGLGEARLASSVEVEGRTRAALASEGRPCAGIAAGASFALRPLTVTARAGFCRSGFDAGGLRATADAWEVEAGATHVWDLPGVSLEAGLALGGAVLRQTFRTAGVAPARTSLALHLSPLVTASRDVGPRAYVYLSGAASTWLFRLEDRETGGSSVEPSFAPRVSMGVGWRL